MGLIRLKWHIGSHRVNRKNANPPEVSDKAHNLKAAGSNPAPATNFQTLCEPKVPEGFLMPENGPKTTPDVLAGKIKRVSRLPLSWRSGSAIVRGLPDSQCRAQECNPQLCSERPQYPCDVLNPWAQADASRRRAGTATFNPRKGSVIGKPGWGGIRTLVTFWVNTLSRRAR